jgi:hypothetical protein
MVTAVGGARAAQIDALHTVADWVAAHPGLPIGEIAVRPGGRVQVHVSTAVLDEAAAEVRRFALAQPSAVLVVSEACELSATRRGRRLELQVPVPGIDLVLWCYESVPSPPPVPAAATCTRAAGWVTVR